MISSIFYLNIRNEIAMDWKIINYNYKFINKLIFSLYNLSINYYKYRSSKLISRKQHLLLL